MRKQNVRKFALGLILFIVVSLVVLVATGRKEMTAAEIEHNNKILSELRLCEHGDFVLKSDGLYRVGGNYSVRRPEVSRDFVDMRLEYPGLSPGSGPHIVYPQHAKKVYRRKANYEEWRKAAEIYALQ